MDFILELMKNGSFSLLDIILLASIGVLIYIITIKMKQSENQVNNTVEGMCKLLEEERMQTEALSKVVFQVKKEVELEKEKNFALREEILVLKNENMRLTNLVTQMEKLIEQYKEEIKILKSERGK